MKNCLLLILSGTIAISCQSSHKSGSEGNILQQDLGNWKLFSSNNVQGCSGKDSLALTVRIPIQSRANRFRVFAIKPDYPMKFFEAYRYATRVLKWGKYRLLALMNAGFFDIQSGMPLSYYKSSFQKKWHNFGNARPGRPCLIFDSSAKQRLRIEETEASAVSDFNSSDSTEVLCGGPILISGGKLSWRWSMERGGFLPQKRADGMDPLGYQQNIPRSAACMAMNGDLLISSYQGTVARCGPTIPELASRLKESHCFTAMNFDDGGSVAMFAIDRDGTARSHFGLEDRPVPVWLAVGWR